MLEEEQHVPASIVPGVLLDSTHRVVNSLGMGPVAQGSKQETDAQANDQLVNETLLIARYSSEDSVSDRAVIANARA
jgi:hypothetical protein